MRLEKSRVSKKYMVYHGYEHMYSYIIENDTFLATYPELEIGDLLCVDITSNWRKFE